MERNSQPGTQSDKPETRISIRFPPDVLAGMRTLMRAHERSFNGEIIWALREYIARQSAASSEQSSERTS